VAVLDRFPELRPPLGAEAALVEADRCLDCSGPYAQPHDLSVKVERAAAVDGPAFLNVLTDCPLGWGHEPRTAPHVVAAAVETGFWPLYEVVDGAYRLTYEPESLQPIERWLEGQKRFAHLLRPESAHLVEAIQERADHEWAALRERCDEKGARS
jgi:pyruvate ferredoxin oxidoreductase beta subunit